MRIWITTEDYPDCCCVHVVKPTNWIDGIEAYENTGEDSADQCTSICRFHLKRLLKGTGKELPAHGSKEIVTVMLRAK